MKAGALIGFTEAELALILVVVFAVVLPMRQIEATGEPGAVLTTSDSLKIALDSLESEVLRRKRLEDSLRTLEQQRPQTPVAIGSLRSPADPSCALLPERSEPRRPFGAIRFLDNGYELDGRSLDLRQLADAIRPFTDRAAALRCKYSMTIVYSSSLPAGRIGEFRRLFNGRYFISDVIED